MKQLGSIFIFSLCGIGVVALVYAKASRGEPGGKITLHVNGQIEQLAANGALTDLEGGLDEDVDAPIRTVRIEPSDAESNGSSPPIAKSSGIGSTETEVASLTEEDEFALLTYKRKIVTLQTRISWLETELAVCGSESASGTIANWLSSLRPDERPDSGTVRLLGGLLFPYEGVHLSAEEGLWITERIRARDWKQWAPTTDEALIMFLGAHRLSEELSEEKLMLLRDEWREEGFFD